MESKLINKCCDKCTHTADKQCKDFVECKTEGPICHKDAKCKDKVKKIEKDKNYIFVGTGTCGLGAGAGDTLKAVNKYIENKKLDFEVVEVGCIGLCSVEPIMDVKLKNKTRVAFQKVKEKDVETLLDEVLKGSINKEKVLYQFKKNNSEDWDGVEDFNNYPFFKNQKRWVLKNCGITSPNDIEEYIKNNGYKALSKTLMNHTSEEICNEIEKSGLRGRGGGGFPTGKKWKFALETKSHQKYLVCNADEGDPGAFMDRAVIEGEPHRLLEGLIIAAYAIGATKAYIYIRAEYPLAIKRLEQAIADAKNYGFVGYNILDSGFNLDIVIKKGAGAFVCGEETALINSIEGKRGMPRPRPPYPAVKGLFDKPTVINNVETLANIPNIILNGSGWFASIGTKNSKGTKVFALSGKVNRTGLVEVAMGTAVRDIIFDIGGGIPNNKAFKAAQIGGPSGGCVPKSQLDIEVDYESLKNISAMMGSGGLVVMDEDTCMVDVAKYFMEFIQRESCGKCIPCREGTKKILGILEGITRGRKNEKDISPLERFRGIIMLKRLANVIKDTSLCGLGQSAPNPILSTLKWFQDEYEEHIYERTCRAGACSELITYVINESKCKGCGICIKKCPNNAIKGAIKSPHYIVEENCIKCGACIEACPFSAITKETLKEL